MISIFILVALGGQVLLKPLHNNVTLSLSIKAKTTIALQVMNGSSGPIEVWSCGFWPNHQMTLVDTKGIPVPMTALGKIGAKRFGDPNRDKNVRVKIAAGKSYGYETPPLADAFVLKSGSYVLTVVYRDISKGKMLMLKTSEIAVNVK